MKEIKDWNDESHYALNVYEKVLSIIGVWPLTAGEFKSIARCFLAILIQVNITNIIIYTINKLNKIKIACKVYFHHFCHDFFITSSFLEIVF